MVLFDSSGNFLSGAEIPLATKRGRHIPNERAPQFPNERMEAAKRVHLASHPEASVRSLSSTYNCMGMVFASRRTCIEPEHLGMILEDDEYRRLRSESELTIGDLVVYRGSMNEVTHVGVISRIDLNLVLGRHRTFVLSQWGRDGEYIHEINDVSPYLGNVSEFWTDRI